MVYHPVTVPVSDVCWKEFSRSKLFTSVNTADCAVAVVYGCVVRSGKLNRMTRVDCTPKVLADARSAVPPGSVTVPDPPRAATSVSRSASLPFFSFPRARMRVPVFRFLGAFPPKSSSTRSVPTCTKCLRRGASHPSSYTTSRVPSSSLSGATWDAPPPCAAICSCTNGYAPARIAAAATMDARRSFMSAASIPLLVKGDATKRREQHRIPWHLQAEVDGCLHGEGEEAAEGAEPHPVRRAVGRREAPADGDDESGDRDQDRHPQQEPAFDGELQVVVVRLPQVVRRNDGGVEERRDAVGVQTRSRCPEVRGHRRRATPDRQAAAEARRIRGVEPRDHLVEAGPVDGHQQRERHQRDRQRRRNPSAATPDGGPAEEEQRRRYAGRHCRATRRTPPGEAPPVSSSARRPARSRRSRRTARAPATWRTDSPTDCACPRAHGRPARPAGRRATRPAD